MEIISNTYDERRAYIAPEIADQLGIKPPSKLLREVAVANRFMPYPKPGEKDYSPTEKGECSACGERSLLTMGAVFRYGGTCTYIDPETGETMTAPDSKAVIKHLEECGYQIAEYGKCYSREYADMPDQMRSKAFLRGIAARISPFTSAKAAAIDKPGCADGYFPGHDNTSSYCAMYTTGDFMAIKGDMNLRKAFALSHSMAYFETASLEAYVAYQKENVVYLNDRKFEATFNPESVSES